MPRALDREVDEIVERELSASHVELPDCQQPTEHRDDLEVDQLGRGKSLITQALPGKVPVGPVVLKQRRFDHQPDDD